MKMKIANCKITVNKKQLYLTYKNFNYYLYCLHSKKLFFRRGIVSNRKKFYYEPKYFIDFSYVNAQT